MEILEEVTLKVDEEKPSVAENQISFDFLSTPATIEKAENHDWVADETLVVLLRAKGGLSPDFSISGKSMLDWVKLATAGCKQKVLDEPDEENLLQTIGSAAEGFKFVAVFYSDTPLLKHCTFLEIMDFFSKRGMNVLRLKRGYVFKSEFLQSAKMLLSSAVEVFGEEDFTLINTPAAASMAFKVLNKRILEYHKEQGVTLFGEDTIFVDADVEIEEGTVIYPNNVIKGESFIGKCVILESGNYIIDTIVCDEAFICQSYLENSKVEVGKTVGPFKKLINEKI